MYSKVNLLESRDPDKPQPQLTAELVPLADKILHALETKDLDAARTDCVQLGAQVHARYGSYLRSKVSHTGGDSFYERYLKISNDCASLCAAAI